MTFEPKKIDEVFEDMRQRTSVVTDFEVGSVTRTVYESFAYELALLYEKMRLVYLSAYVDTAQGQQLDLLVSILGIRRGVPDFATGKITFERDVGKEEINIPLGTLVATEDTPESPKKVYQTIESAVFLSQQSTVEVKIQAVNRGEGEVTAAETLVVMPRPIPGIKAVINRTTTQFTGKRRETDEELRNRAKNALISSGKASVIAIENALLALPGVKDVKVKENFHFARGQVRLARGGQAGDISIAKGVRLIAHIGDIEIPFETAASNALPAADNSVSVTVQSLLEGRAGEVPVTTGVNWQIAGEPPLPTLTATNSEPIQLEDFGIVEVFVDGVDFTDESEKQRIQTEIDRVRAAGIFVLLKSTETVNVDGVFRIEIDPDLTLSAEDRVGFEKAVQAEIIKYIKEQRMGQSLLFSQIIKHTLSLDGINNLEDFIITTYKQADREDAAPFEATAKRIDLEESQKFKAQNICVASNTKLLPVTIQFKVDSIDENKQETVLNDLNQFLSQYFTTLKIGDSVQKSRVEEQINAVADLTLISDTLTLTPKSWCRPPLLEDENVVSSFVEQPVLGNVFAYDKFLKLIGALKLTLPTTITSAEKDAIRQKIKQGVESYLENLSPESDVVFADLIDIAARVEPVLTVDLDAQDFQAALNPEKKDDANDQVVNERVEDNKVAVKPFEKPFLRSFCITGDVETVRIEVTALELELIGTLPPNIDDLKASLRQAVKNKVNNFLNDTKPGQNLIFDNFSNALQNLISGVNYTLKKISLTANSTCDNRIQATGIETAKDIHIRSVEIAKMAPIQEASVIIADPTSPA